MNTINRNSRLLMLSLAALSLNNLSAMNSKELITDLESKTTTSLTPYKAPRTALKNLAARAAVVPTLVVGALAATATEAFLPTGENIDVNAFMSNRNNNFIKRDVGIAGAALTGLQALRHSSKMLAFTTLAWMGYAAKHAIDSSETTYKNLAIRQKHYDEVTRYAKEDWKTFNEKLDQQNLDELNKKAPSYWNGSLEKALQEKYDTLKTYINTQRKGITSYAAKLRKETNENWENHLRPAINKAWTAGLQGAESLKSYQDYWFNQPSAPEAKPVEMQAQSYAAHGANSAHSTPEKENANQ